MNNSPSNSCSDLETCLIHALTTFFPKKTLLWTKEDHHISPNSIGEKIENLIADLLTKQDQRSIDGIAYRIGQSFFYEYLYRFDQQLNFSDLSFKLQSFENKKEVFLSTLAQQIQKNKIICEWQSEKNTLIVETNFTNNSVMTWFIKGIFTDALFWLSNGKQNDVQIEQHQNKNSITYQITIIEW
jgi:hypothetical protein